MNFRQTALDNRYQLIVAIAFLERQKGCSASSTAYEICQKATQWGYTGPRKPPKGNTLDMWIKRKEVPAWASKAVSRMLLDNPNFKPQSQQQIWALALTLAEAFPDLLPNELHQRIPLTLQEQITFDLIHQACENRKN